MKTVFFKIIDLIIHLKRKLRSFAAKKIQFYHNPLIVMGLGRSGTTILLEALGQHPQILSAGGESPFIIDLASLTKIFEYSELTMRKYYLTSIQFSKEYLYRQLRRLCFETAFGKYYGNRKIMKTLFNDRKHFFNIKYWSVKTFPDYTNYKEIMALYPNAKFIHIVRNGLDVVQSRTIFPGFRDMEFITHCEWWVGCIEKFGYVSKMSHCLMVRHEDLLSQPVEFFKRIFEFLEIDDHDNSSAFARNNLIHPLSENTKNNINVMKEFKSRPPSHQSWTVEQKKIFKDICSNVMKKMGYHVPF